MWWPLFPGETNLTNQHHWCKPYIKQGAIFSWTAFRTVGIFIALFWSVSLADVKKQKNNNFTGLHAVLCKLVACRTTFSGNSLSNPFVWLYRSVTSLWRNLGPLFFTAVLQFIKDCRQLFMHGSRDRISLRLRSGIWAVATPWFFPFFLFLAILLQVCCYAWDRCPNNFG